MAQATTERCWERVYDDYVMQDGDVAERRRSYASTRVVVLGYPSVY